MTYLEVKVSYRTKKGAWKPQRYVQSVNDTRNVTQNRQTDVDQKVSTASALQEDTQRRQDDGKNDLADVAIRSSQYWSHNSYHCSAMLSRSTPTNTLVAG